MAQILDGRSLAVKLKDDLKNEVEQLKTAFRSVPSIVSIIVGNNPSASIYINAQRKMAENIGIRYELKNFPETISQSELSYVIEKLNTDQLATGIIVQTPLPKQINHQALVDAINPLKDIEGVGVMNMGKLVFSKTGMVPCTAAASLALIKSSGVKLRGKEAVIVGRSEIVGKPLSFLLLNESATVTICHTGTSEAGKLVDHIKRADIVVGAVGKPNFIQGNWIKDGAVVIDVGINEVEGKIVGDIDFEAAKEHAGFITPVPGGVGPVTVVSLMKNCLEAFKLQQEK